MKEKATDGLSLRTYLHVLARWKWAVIGVTLVVTLAGTAYTWTRTPMYAASSELLYIKQIDIVNPLSQSYIDTTAQQAEIESVPTVVGSESVRSAAQERMEPQNAEAPYSVGAILEPGLRDTYSNLVTMQAISPYPAVAADAANAYAEAFIDWGKESARDKVRNALTIVRSQLESFTTEASTQTSEYAALRQSLQQLQLLEASASSSFQIITRASEPVEPFAPDKPRGLVIALAGGLVLGIGLAFLLEQFDTRVRSDDQIAEILGLPVVGHVPPPAKQGPESGVMRTLTNPSGSSAEAFRLLRSNLEFLMLDGDVRTLLVSSSVQGEGKSVAICNLAASLALAGKRVVLVDADLRSPKVHTYLGIPNAVGVSSVLARRAEIDEALAAVALDVNLHQSSAMTRKSLVSSGGGARTTGVTRVAGRGLGTADTATSPDETAGWAGDVGQSPILGVLTSGPVPPNPGEMIASQRFGKIIEHLRADADFVLVDTPAMLPVGDTAAIAKVADAIIYVVNTEWVRRPELQRARAQLAHLPCPVLGVIEVTNAKERARYGGYYSRTQ